MKTLIERMKKLVIYIWFNTMTSSEFIKIIYAHDYSVFMYSVHIVYEILIPEYMNHKSFITNTMYTDQRSITQIT